MKTNMTDYELLTTAAKAAGVAYDETASQPTEGRKWWGLWLLIDGEPSEYDRRYWNPLKDDGDAFRLAMGLRLIVKPGKHQGDGCTAESQQGGVAGCTAFREDCMEQARYAIVRAAAEVAQA